MIKKLRPFLCLILAVILPFCFVACKSSDKSSSGGGETPAPGGGISGGDTDSGGSGTQPPQDQDETPEVSYVLDDAEVNRVLTDSFDDCKEFVINLNNSNLLKDNEYSVVVGGKTYPIFDYAFYPSRFVSGYTGTFDTVKTYAYQAVNYDKKYFEIRTNGNDTINVTILIDADISGYLTAYFYEFKVNEGNLDSLKISYINTDSSRIEFSDTLLDFKNSVCEISLGNVSEFSSNRTFLNTYFNSEKFGNISAEKWGYSYCQKFDFSNEKKYDLNVSKMPNNANMIANVDKFGFLDVFDKLDIYRQTSNKLLTNIGNDYFLQYSSVGFMSYDSVNCIFKMSTGGGD